VPGPRASALLGLTKEQAGERHRSAAKAVGRQQLGPESTRNPSSPMDQPEVVSGGVPGGGAVAHGRRHRPDSNQASWTTGPRASGIPNVVVLFFFVIREQLGKNVAIDW